eukprot:CAMPEP_0168515492 /NCGR_PEP_ID=MMETSP0405-20121227/4794_1 /TAXON_ID=498012 /ORGANISM="Trichosphaerium sp, Strain Am-I-7 wt" /LENGTH=188 /DNA_ID=CAMNT_0008534933 /DNA_START=320 /DNA_END=883 /DNA_ORIENTATION=+
MTRVKIPVICWYRIAVDPKKRRSIKLQFKGHINQYKVKITGTPKRKADTFDDCLFDCCDSPEDVNNKYSTKGLKIHHWCPEVGETSEYEIILAFAFPGTYVVTYINKGSGEPVQLITIYVTSHRATAGFTVDRKDYIYLCNSRAEMEDKYIQEINKKTSITKKKHVARKRNAKNTQLNSPQPKKRKLT